MSCSELGTECHVEDCNNRILGLKDGWPASTRGGPVCKDCWDYHRENHVFPDEERGSV